MYLDPDFLVRAIIAERHAEAERWRRSSPRRQDRRRTAAERRPRRRVRLHLPVVRHRPV